MRAAWMVVLIACSHEPIEPPEQPAPQAAPIAKRAPKPLPPLAAKLANIELFAIGGVGFAGETTEGETLTLELAKEPGAVAAFERIVTGDNHAAALYAYWALRTLDPARAAQHRPHLARNSTPISTMSGCIGYEATVTAIVAELDGQRTAMPKP